MASDGLIDASVDATPVAGQTPWFLKSSCPVLFPHHRALNLSDAEFDLFLKEDLATRKEVKDDLLSRPQNGGEEGIEMMSETFTEVEVPGDGSTTADINEGLDKMDIEHKGSEDADEKPEHPFIAGLTSYGKETAPTRDMSNMTFTDNADLAHTSSTDARVDLFYELEDGVTGPRIRDLLNGAWAVDPLMTLKIIFNARSIHLGKASRIIFYRSAGWLAQEHPLTLISNLKWLSRPVIEKKIAKPKAEDPDLVVIEAEATGDTAYDVKNGVSHGYWKDLLNLLALSANDKLNPLNDPRDILNVTRNPRAAHNITRKPRTTYTDAGKPRGVRSATAKREGARARQNAREKRHGVRDGRHEAALAAFENNHVHRALHLAIARLFATQLRADLDLLNSGAPKAKRNISLCAKWAPSTDNFHDRHTFIVTSIAELLHPQPLAPQEDIARVGSITDTVRDLAIRYAREQYRKSISALRAHLDVVERELTAKTLCNIKYERVPSVAMSNYAKIFATKDEERFGAYLDRVAEGKSKISGAVLLPGTLVRAARDAPSSKSLAKTSKGGTRALVESRLRMMQGKVVDGQWNTLVNRIKESGTLSSSIAVCDISGSMESPRFSDGTTPMDSSIGLSLLIAEVTAPPFGGHFITFSENPKMQSVDLTKGLREMCDLIWGHWGMNTDFVAVFERLILPMAIENKLAPADMVKRIFVFSDMQFDAASIGNTWTTSFERISKAYAAAGYEMPELVFWNLAGGASVSGVAGKPVTTDDVGTALVSGYSQGMLKAFLDNGSFEDVEQDGDVVVEEEVVEEGVKESVGGEVVRLTKKQKMDPLSTVKKVVGHKAYDMLNVFD